MLRPNSQPQSNKRGLIGNGRKHYGSTILNQNSNVSIKIKYQLFSGGFLPIQTHAQIIKERGESGVGSAVKPLP
jgi:hypothetical protein